MMISDIPICIIGAGGIVHDAHLPAYRMAGFKVGGIMDKDAGKAKQLAKQFNISGVFATPYEMVQEYGTQAVYDIALPASEILNVLKQLPDRAAVLLQKPMGESLEEAKAIVDLCSRKQQLAGVNFQLRFAPFIQEARRLIDSGRIGEIVDIEVYINVETPWKLWNFLESKSRMEINYHSIHYIDLIRAFLGNPRRVIAHTLKHPDSPKLSSVKTNIIMDYGEWVRAAIHTNHNHGFGRKNQEAYLKIEGTKGAIKTNFGALINYPHGVPDYFEYVLVEGDLPPQWQSKEINGTWFPHAFIGSMEQLLLAKAGEIQRPENTVEDALDTMRCVEAAYLNYRVPINIV